MIRTAMKIAAIIVASLLAMAGCVSYLVWIGSV